jgi:alkaline phosphatase D
MKHIAFIIALVFTCSQIFAQAKLVAGPMLGDVDYRSAIIWAEFETDNTFDMVYWNQNNTQDKKVAKAISHKNLWFNPVKYYLVGLEAGNTYNYAFKKNNALQTIGSFNTKTLWQWRNPAPNFTFLTGSCNYTNQPEHDRPGKAYGGDSSIFETMAKENSAFMLWLGDAWYTREVDFSSEYGLSYRISHDRKVSCLKNFLKAMPQYAIWDDHDFGPNDCSSSYIFKDYSKKLFDSYFCNPTSGIDNKGIYTKINYADVDLFLLDGRYFKTSDKLSDSINGQPNLDKVMLGKQQMDWLKNALLASNDANRVAQQTANASFKIICIGSQVLNTLSPYEKFSDYKTEYNELLNFIKEYKINGVVFLTGDRHFTEVIKLQQPNMYPLYDLTISPLTSGTSSPSKAEKNNPNQVLLVEKTQNYGKINISGPAGNRIMHVGIVDINGKEINAIDIKQTDLIIK